MGPVESQVQEFRGATAHGQSGLFSARCKAA